MRIEQLQWSEAGGWLTGLPGGSGASAQLVLIFGGTEALKNTSWQEVLRAAYPQAILLGCSTAGEIRGTLVSDETVVMTAVHFAAARVIGGMVKMGDVEDSFHAGQTLADLLDPAGLRHVLVFSEGNKVNGSDLVRGLVGRLPENITVTGGLAGDGSRFRETLVVWDGRPHRDAIAILGLYGEDLKIGYGSLGGWDPFGPERVITRSRGNVLHELDGQSALELYKRYLGEHAQGLPATALLFPLSMQVGVGETPLVRTILQVDEREQSMTFAGDVPQGARVRLMKANFDRLIDGAHGAAQTSYQPLGASPDLAILVSCVGRKMVLKQRVEEEVEAVREVMGDRTVLAGFYAYGEISPFTSNARCELHNQTMTITTLSE